MDNFGSMDGGDEDLAPIVIPGGGKASGAIDFGSLPGCVRPFWFSRVKDRSLYR